MNTKRFFRCLLDIGKPKYALMVELTKMPSSLSAEGFKMVPIAVIMRVPYKRKLSTPFNVFYNSLSSEAYNRGGFIFCGSKSTLKRLYGVGSVLPHNMKRAVTFHEPHDK